MLRWFIAANSQPAIIVVMKVSKVTKRKSTVVSSQTYRKMVEEALEEAPACALDLHGIYDALSLKYEQYRDDSVVVDWRVRAKTKCGDLILTNLNICLSVSISIYLYIPIYFQYFLEFYKALLVHK